MASPFRPAKGPHTGSKVLAELARLWDQATRLAAVEGRSFTQKKVAKAARVPYTTVNSWATGAHVPRDLDDLFKVGTVLAEWAGERPSERVVWSQLMRTSGTPSVPPVPAAAKDVRPGQPLEQVTDPFPLEVHRPIEATGPGSAALPVLPPYAPRTHDEHLARVVARAASGASAMATLVGGSSTGKTRACWEALAVLRDQGGWWLWHPFDPTGPEAALAGLPRVGPRTVVWLNEIQLYLDASGDIGERVAAALCTLLADPGRAPVLVLSTLWPHYWDALTRHGQLPDRHLRARTVLTGTDITVAGRFTDAQLKALPQSAATDPRWAEAATAPDGQVIQYMAGVPELLARYRNAPPAARAVIDAAMDAHRLGHRRDLPYALLEAAAPAYLNDTEWHTVAGQDRHSDWLEQALAYTAAPCKGVLGPVTRLRPRPGIARTGASRTRWSDPGARQAVQQRSAEESGPLYRLADYLDQHGRRHRHDRLPPAGLWDALDRHTTDFDDRFRLGQDAAKRGLFRIAADLLEPSAQVGDLSAMRLLADLLWQAGHDQEADMWINDEDGLPPCAGTVPLYQQQLKQALLQIDLLDCPDPEIWARWTRAWLEWKSGDPLPPHAPPDMPTWPIAQRRGLDMDNVTRILSQCVACSYAETATGQIRLGVFIEIRDALLGTLVSPDLNMYRGSDEARWTRLAESGDPDARRILARLRVLEGLGSKAEDWLRRDPSPAAWRDLARLLERMGRWEESEACLRRAADGGNLDAACDLLLRDGRTCEAEQLLMHAIEMGHRPAQNRLIALLNHVGRTDEAERLSKFGIEPGGSVAHPW